MNRLSIISAVRCGGNGHKMVQGKHNGSWYCTRCGVLRRVMQADQHGHIHKFGLNRICKQCGQPSVFKEEE